MRFGRENAAMVYSWLRVSRQPGSFNEEEEEEEGVRLLPTHEWGMAVKGKREGGDGVELGRWATDATDLARKHGAQVHVEEKKTAVGRPIRERNEGRERRKGKREGTGPRTGHRRWAN